MVPVETIVGSCVLTPTSLTADDFFAEGMLFKLELVWLDGRAFWGNDRECDKGWAKASSASA